MKAWVVRRNGPPDSMTFEDLPDPGTPPGMLRIEVEAAGVNFFDSLLVAGTYQQKPDLPFVPGAEVAGVVVGVPRDSGSEPGDRAAGQLGKAAGAVVIASVGSAEKAEVCVRLGADLVVQHHEQDVAQAVKDFTRGHGADVVYDPVGGDAFKRSTKCIAFEGRL